MSAYEIGELAGYYSIDALFGFATVWFIRSPTKWRFVGWAVAALYALTQYASLKDGAFLDLKVSEFLFTLIIFALGGCMSIAARSFLNKKRAEHFSMAGPSDKQTKDAQLSFQKGLDAFQRGDFPRALEEWRPLAEEGYAEARHNMGVAYENGIGVTLNYKGAVEWYRLAAEQGHTESQVNLGVIYSTGKGVLQDQKAAVKWFRLAAEQGVALAQHNLGALYYTGQGVAKDVREAAKWIQLAAEQGIAEAQYNLGAMIANGEGLQQNNVLAHMWLFFSSSLGNPTAKVYLEELEQSMTPAQISEAQKLAAEWKPKQ